MMMMMMNFDRCFSTLTYLQLIELYYCSQGKSSVVWFDREKRGALSPGSEIVPPLLSQHSQGKLRVSDAHRKWAKRNKVISHGRNVIYNQHIDHPVTVEFSTDGITYFFFFTDSRSVSGSSQFGRFTRRSTSAVRRSRQHAAVRRLVRRRIRLGHSIRRYR